MDRVAFMQQYTPMYEREKTRSMTPAQLTERDRQRGRIPSGQRPTPDRVPRKRTPQERTGNGSAHPRSPPAGEPDRRKDEARTQSGRCRNDPTRRRAGGNSESCRTNAAASAVNFSTLLQTPETIRRGPISSEPKALRRNTPARWWKSSGKSPEF